MNSCPSPSSHRRDAKQWSVIPQSPVTVQKHHGGWQPVVVVDDELQVPHGLVALVCQSGVLRPHRLLWVVHLVHHMRYVADIGVQPGGVLHTQWIFVLVVSIEG